MSKVKRKPNTQYVLSLSYGKDSIACLEAIMQLGYPLDRIVHAEVWATQNIPAELPPMLHFKEKADRIIKEKYGFQVEHFCGKDEEGHKITYETYFYERFQNGENAGRMYGFPFQRGAWCTSRLKQRVKDNIGSDTQVRIVRYLGIAADEPKRIYKHSKKPNIVLPLVDIGWDEAYCRQWCEENDLLSPIYTTSDRGGCWFCHNQSIEQLRLLRRDYPHLWKLLLKWDLDSPVTFKSDGHTVHDFDKRFYLEEQGVVPMGSKFRWKFVCLPKDEKQITIFDEE